MAIEGIYFCTSDLFLWYDQPLDTPPLVNIYAVLNIEFKNQ